LGYIACFFIGLTVSLKERFGTFEGNFKGFFMAKTKEVQPESTGEGVAYKPAEIEKLIVDLANQGMNASEIGMTLRDSHGVPSVKKLTGKRIEAVLGEHKLLADVPRDLLNLIRRSVELQKHLSTNRKDYTAKRGYQLAVSKIQRLVTYYKGAGKLPASWRYTPETAALLVK